MNHMVDTQPSLILDIPKFENVFEAIIDFFKDIKTKIVSLNEVEARNEVILESQKNILLSNLDFMITTTRGFEKENENLPKHSYILIRLKDMVDILLSENGFIIQKMDLLLEILSLYQHSLNKMEKIASSNKLTEDNMIFSVNSEFEKFSNDFTDKEMEFYSFVEDDDTYKNSITSTYNLLKEID